MEDLDHNTTDGIDPAKNNSLSEGNILPFCPDCGKELCLRQKVINLALGNTEIMYCLICLGKRNNNTPEQLLAKIKKYILARECFRKEWIKYTSVNQCPNPSTCFPDTCFQDNL